jgi:hypothetical protein
MKKLTLLVLLAAACSDDSKTTSTPDAPANNPPVEECFQGTPQSYDQLINACVDQSVTRIVKYPDLPAMRAALPKLNDDGTLPPLL